MPDHHDYPYGACLLSCTCPANTSSVALFDDKEVQLVERGETLLRPLIRTIVLSDATRRRYRLAICIAPLYGHVPALRLWEFVRYYERQGVEQFTFYITPHCSPETVGQLLRLVVAGRSRIELLRWNLPLRWNGDVHYQGIMGAVNDCALRRRRDADVVLEGVLRSVT